MKKLLTQVIVVAICFAIGVLSALFIINSGDKGEKEFVASTPQTTIEYYGVSIPNTPKAKSEAVKLHLICNTGDSWYSDETSDDCKARLLTDVVTI